MHHFHHIGPLAIILVPLFIVLLAIVVAGPVVSGERK